MVVNYFGNGCFRLQSGETSILVNPENNRLKADVVLKTIISTETKLAIGDLETPTVSFPGEYEVKGVEILGFSMAGESTEKFLKTSYSIIWDEMKFVFLGHLSKPLDAVLMEEFSDPDILFLPVGGGDFLEPEIAAKIAKQLEAKVIIPSFYKTPDDFLKALGKKSEVMEKFVFKQKDILEDKARPIILKEG